MSSGLETLASRFQFYESENARVFRLIDKQVETIQGLLTVEDLETRFNLLKSDITITVFKDIKDKFAFKEELQYLGN
jgi:hypothetical protein